MAESSAKIWRSSAGKLAAGYWPLLAGRRSTLAQMQGVPWYRL